MVVARRVILHIRGRIFDSILDQDIAFFDGMRTGDLQQRTFHLWRSASGKASDARARAFAKAAKAFKNRAARASLNTWIEYRALRRKVTRARLQ